MTLAQGQTLTSETGVMLNVASATIDTQDPDNTTPQSAGTNQVVNVDGTTDTITLANGTWSDLGFANGDALVINTPTDANSNAVSTITYTAANWNVPVSITLHNNANYVLPGSGGNQASNPATDMSFPAQPHTLANIQGPLIVDGGTQAGTADADRFGGAALRNAEHRGHRADRARAKARASRESIHSRFSTTARTRNETG